MCVFFYFFRKKNDTDVSKVEELKGRYEIIDKENKLIISKPELYDAGRYSCSIPELSEVAEINVIGRFLSIFNLFLPSFWSYNVSK